MSHLLCRKGNLFWVWSDAKGEWVMCPGIPFTTAGTWYEAVAYGEDQKAPGDEPEKNE